MIDAETKSKLIFSFGQKIISLLDLSQNVNDVSGSLCLENAVL